MASSVSLARKQNLKPLRWRDCFLARQATTYKVYIIHNILCIIHWFYIICLLYCIYYNRRLQSQVSEPELIAANRNKVELSAAKTRKVAVLVGGVLSLILLLQDPDPALALPPARASDPAPSASLSPAPAAAQAPLAAPAVAPALAAAPHALTLTLASALAPPPPLLLLLPVLLLQLVLLLLLLLLLLLWLLLSDKCFDYEGGA